MCVSASKASVHVFPPTSKQFSSSSRNIICATPTCFVFFHKVHNIILQLLEPCFFSLYLSVCSLAYFSLPCSILLCASRFYSNKPCFYKPKKHDTAKLVLPFHYHSLEFCFSQLTKVYQKSFSSKHHHRCYCC